jgi:hypothetical protein
VVDVHRVLLFEVSEPAVYSRSRHCSLQENPSSFRPLYIQTALFSRQIQPEVVAGRVVQILADAQIALGSKADYFWPKPLSPPAVEKSSRPTAWLYWRFLILTQVVASGV